MGIGQSLWYSYSCGECGVKTEVENSVDRIVDGYCLFPV